MYSDAYIERWAEPFVRLRLRERLASPLSSFCSARGATSGRCRPIY